ncbi:MAG: YceI family protein [Bdellovibrionota bacterium]
MKYLIFLWVSLHGLTLFSATDSVAKKDATVKTIDLSKEETSVRFLALVKPGSLRINGTGAKLSGTITLNGTQLAAEITVSLKDLETGISLRDQHMKEKYLEVEKYPTATLRITDMALPQSPLSSHINTKGVEFKGILNVHGVDSAVTGTADIDSTGSMIVAEVKTRTTISAHNIEKPGYLGVKVADEIEIQALMKLKK